MIKLTASIYAIRETVVYRASQHLCMMCVRIAMALRLLPQSRCAQPKGRVFQTCPPSEDVWDPSPAHPPRILLPLLPKVLA